MSLSVSAGLLGIQISVLRAIPASRSRGMLDLAGSARRELLSEVAPFGPKGPGTDNLLNLDALEVEAASIPHNPSVAFEDR